MAEILQTIFTNAFSWMKMYEFYKNFIEVYSLLTNGKLYPQHISQEDNFFNGKQ